MQRILQINIAGRVVPIEENAYLILKDYISSLERQFVSEPGREEILQDIESRIAELFAIRLQSGAPAIDLADVNKVIETLGPASAIGSQASGAYSSVSSVPGPYTGQHTASGQRRLFRNPADKILGGVCSGIGNYFDVDPVIVRLIWVALSFLGLPILAYFIAWIVIPIARTPQDFAYMTDGTSMNFHDITRNVSYELQDLKKRGEEMSRELKEFFSKKR